MFGARQPSDSTLFSPLRRLIGRAMAQELKAFVVPGPEIALVHGLDLARAGLRVAASPRDANVLLVVGALPASLMDAVSVTYAQMPRPRAILTLGAEELGPLPAADVSGELSQPGLTRALESLRGIIAENAFGSGADAYEAPALQSRIEYTCPMHPEIVSDEPGKCPICGMFLVPRETSAAGGAGASGGHDHAAMANTDAGTAVASKAAEHGGHGVVAKPGQYVCPMHPEVISDEPGSCPKCGMDLVPVEAPAGYVCPMHPEVTSEEPGSCPKCGMDLVAVEADPGDHGSHDHHDCAHGETRKYSCPMHPEVVTDEPGSCPKCGMDLVAEEAGHGGEGSVTYSCPMHPEVVSDEPGSCPKCGMDLVAGDEAALNSAGDGHGSHDHGKHDHGAHDHGSADKGLVGLEPGFMSMIEMTEGMPRSSDGLQMEWITTPFGPFFPGLPGGLTLEMVLDGDTVVDVTAGSLVGHADLLAEGPMAADRYVARLAAAMPMAPVAYGLLACRAIEAAAGERAGEAIEKARDVALDRERVASHLVWLAQLGRQVGLPGIERDSAGLAMAVRRGDLATIRALMPAVNSLLARVRDTRFLARRLGVVGAVAEDGHWRGPAGAQNNAAGRLNGRLAAVAAAMGRIDAARDMAAPELGTVGKATGHGHAEVETARGRASLHVEIESGRVMKADLDTPSTHHLALVAPMSAQMEVADALVAVASLDLDPWEIGA